MGDVLSAPLDVFLGITNLCNLSCKHCNVYFTRNSPNDLSTQEWISFLRRLAELKVFTLWISGGEPFCRKDLFTILSEIESHHFRYGLNTNATLIDEYTSRHLSELKKLDDIVVSLDGSNGPIHDALRGKGAFDMTIRGTKNLLKWNQNVSSYTTVTELNYNDLENIVRLGKELGLTSIKFNELLPLGNAYRHLDQLRLSNSQRREVFYRIMDLNQKYEHFITGAFVDMEEMFADFNELEGRNPDDSETYYLHDCGAGTQKCTVRPDGWVVPCDRLWELKVGNIREEDFQIIWLSSSVFKDMRKRSSVSFKQLSECEGCPYQPLCTGGCPAVSYYLKKSIFRTDPLSCYRIFISDGFPYEEPKATALAQ